jgi:hypothetical protein
MGGTAGRSTTAKHRTTVGFKHVLLPSTNYYMRPSAQPVKASKHDTYTTDGTNKLLL